MITLCLDLGTATGWALCNESVIDSGTASFKNSRFDGGGMRFLKFTRWLDDMRSKNTLGTIYFEAVYKQCELARTRCK